MDFSQFNSRDAGAAGAWMQVMNPFNGKPIFDDGKPCEVLVYGAESKVGLAAMDDARKAMLGEVSPEDGQARTIKAVAPLVGGFRNIDRKDRPAIAPEDVEWFLSQQVSIRSDFPTFLEQVQSFAFKRANFLGNVSGG